MAYGDFKDLTRRTASDKIFCDIAFTNTKNPKYDRYQCGLASMIYKFFDNKTSGSGIKNENTSNIELAEELYKPIIRKFEKRKVHSPFIDNILGADLADMQLISKFDKGIHFLLCVIDIFSKCAWVIALKDQKVITITDTWKNPIEMHSAHNKEKSVVAERFIRIFKNKIGKYDIYIKNVSLDKLDDTANK